MNVPSKSHIYALLVSLCRDHGRLNKVLTSSRTFHMSCCDRVRERVGGKINAISSNGFLRKQTKDTPTSNAVIPLLGKENHGISFLHTLCTGFPFQHEMLGKATTGYDLRFIRHKTKKKRPKSDQSDSDSDEDDNLDADDFNAPAQFKVQKIHVASLRIDSVLSTALGLSRHRMEEIFFGPGILMNGDKVLKKATKMDVGDYVDAIMEKNDDGIKVKRVKLLKVESQKTNTDKLIIKVRVWKAPFLTDNPNKWKADT